MVNGISFESQNIGFWLIGGTSPMVLEVDETTVISAKADKALTSYSASLGVVTTSDTVLSAFGKLGKFASLPSIFNIAAIVDAHTLIVSILPQFIDFRHATLTTGTPTRLLVSATQTLTVPQTATLGTVGGVNERILILAINYNGTVEPAIVNAKCFDILNESSVISTTSIGTGADSAQTIYSLVGRSSVPYRIVGYIDIAQSVAGVWDSSPSLVQGLGGQVTLNSNQVCKAWALFNGKTTGTNAPTAGCNISSIERINTGYYTVNFLIPFLDTNYIMIGNIASNANYVGVQPVIYSSTQYGPPTDKLTTSCKILNAYHAGTGYVVDIEEVYIAFYGN
jgi:hypothetical protein